MLTTVALLGQPFSFTLLCACISGAFQRYRSATAVAMTVRMARA